MRNLEEFINRPEMSDWDPLVKLAVIHHQFESIHPFYDGNGRTGRIVCTIEALGISRPTASRYLEIIVKLGLLDRLKVKKTNYYINRKLTDLLINHAELEDS